MGVLSWIADVFAAQPDPPVGVVLGTAALALVVVGIHSVWRVVRNAITIAHEGGHALVAVLSGRRLQGIRLHSDTSGLTITRGAQGGPGVFFTLLAGYTAPSLLGLGGAFLLALGRITLLLWVSLLLLAAMLVMIRNVFGALSVVVTGAVVFVVSWFATAHVQAVFAYAGVWFLLVGGVRPVFEVQRQRRRGRAPSSDADQLAGLTSVPGLFWVAVFLVVSLGALAAGAVLLGVHPGGYGWPR